MPKMVYHTGKKKKVSTPTKEERYEPSAKDVARSFGGLAGAAVEAITKRKKKKEINYMP